MFLTVQTLFMSTFFGGSDSTWDSPQDQYIRFDDMSVKAGLCPPEIVLDQAFGKASLFEHIHMPHVQQSASCALMSPITRGCPDCKTVLCLFE